MKQFTRREFFDLVWARPMTDLAKEFGLSDVALHKTFKRQRIPTPGLGYWAKVGAGKAVATTSFREISDTNLNTIRIYPGPVNLLSPEVKQAHAKAKAQVKEKKDVTATYASSPLHPYVENLRRKLETVQMQISINKDCYISQIYCLPAFLSQRPLKNTFYCGSCKCIQILEEFISPTISTD